eukprot:CAMPEP_0202814364 /NCGR_PEP_ID=MMETSP1389-20130828/5509_1 /ASSEMBLY_ACC=CAM_ASM_000865 /TAXON_ID=302021 /ORGANISM="Rhodomonas sp., Strain CCMP768" /LENGTH=101 /DNA_ID=CAMNT_0049486123 /DNA_START=17 /DNA_END=322 /DNA_ORIENTATION=-
MALWQHAASRVELTRGEPWFATMDELEPELLAEVKQKSGWDDKFGDRQQEVVVIGLSMDKQAVTDRLDQCLLTDGEMAEESAGCVWFMDDPWPEWEEEDDD